MGIQSIDINADELNKIASGKNESLDELLKNINKNDMLAIQVIESFNETKLLSEYIKKDKNVKEVLFLIFHAMYFYKLRFPKLTFNLESLDSLLLSEIDKTPENISIDSILFKYPSLGYKVIINDLSNVSMSNKNDNDVDSILKLLKDIISPSIEKELSGKTINQIFLETDFFSEFQITKPNTDQDAESEQQGGESELDDDEDDDEDDDDDEDNDGDEDDVENEELTATSELQSLTISDNEEDESEEVSNKKESDNEESEESDNEESESEESDNKKSKKNVK